MEGKKQANSSSSFTAELFGGKEFPSQHLSTGIFASIFPPPSKVVGRNSQSSDLIGSWQKHAPGNQTWPTNKYGSSAKNGEVERCSIPYKDRSSVLQEERVEPCHLSSSIYYGGQDVYSHSQSSQISESYPVFKKDGREDDPNGSNSNDASRGNWWQGSLYY
ncbi:uncharacterized protein LOC133791161 [Humulus lupulus]|uniref:uncharacterized protein LOC133791161 n=1 Tax=Humulus lupulus TaxID=3486 RepID=UPI002B40E471|nr:uncharacterized protein LOC133791161 [Humulus lupulus]